MALLRRFPIPFGSLLYIFRHTSTEFKAASQFRLGRRIPQPGRGLIPFHCLLIVLLCTGTPAVCLPQQKLCPWKALLRSLLETFQRLCLILFDADAICIAITQIGQGRHIVHGSRLSIQHHRLGGIRLYPDPGLQTPAQIRQSQGISPGRRLLVKGQGFTPPLLLHGLVSQCHPVAGRQLLLRY